jgi:serine/threonine-protein kinase haspin
MVTRGESHGRVTVRESTVHVTDALLLMNMLQLGARTKQINSYGKRRRRVVDATDRSTMDPKLISIFDDIPPAPVWTSVVSKMKKRKPITEQKPFSPKVVGLLKKKRLSPLIKKQTRSVAPIIDAESCKSNAGQGIRTDPALISDSSPRAPLSNCRLNIPGSSQKLAKSRFPFKKGTPSKLGKPFSPFVDVDIIVLDGEGRIFSKERRVSRTSIDTDSAPQPLSKDVQVHESGESELETTSQPCWPKRHLARKQAIIMSDDSESQEETLIKNSHLNAPVQGRIFRKERRLSRTSVGTDSAPQPPSKDVQVDESASESELETTSQPCWPKRHLARKQAIIMSDDSESQEETLTKNSHLNALMGSTLHVSKPTLHSVVSPAPYRISRQKITSSSTPPSSSPKLFEQPSPSKHNLPIPSPIFLPSPVEVAIPPEHDSSRRQKVVTSSANQPSKASFQQKVQHFVPRPAPAYPLVPSPILKTRQLTPIRGGRNKRLFDPPSPPSPTTPTDFDLSISAFSDLYIESPSQTQDTYRSEFEVPRYLEPLLEECHQETCGPHNFSAFIESFPFDPISRGNEDVEVRFRKVGEASYSEVFGIGDVVLKVIPIRDESKAGQIFAPDEEDGPAPSDAKDVRKEIIVTRVMGEVYDGFVKLLKAYVVRGRYPEVLLQLWDEYNEKKGSESVRPGKRKFL